MREQQVVLKLDGNLNTGVQVTLEIWLENQRQLEIRGGLPPNFKVAACLQNHWQNYRSIGAPYRIKTEAIIYDGKINPVQACKHSAQELSDGFLAWLDASEFKRIDRQLRDRFSLNQTVRVLIRTSEPQLQKLPWHLWDWVESRQAEVAFSTPEYQNISTQSPANSRVTILAILGHSEGIDIEQDRRLLESLPNVNLVFLVEPTRREINAQLWEKSWDILFFAGHSETQGEEGKIYINPLESLTIGELKYGLKQAVQLGLKLAIFNSCDGLGLAKKLSDLHIPRMIVMREMVPDEVAQSFLKYFLASFSTGKSFTFAVRKARERLHDDFEGNFPCASWLPVIFQHPLAGSLTWEQLRKPPHKSHSKPQQISLFRWKDWKKILLVSVVITSLVLGMRSLGILQIWELKTLDALIRLKPDEPPDPRLLIVTVTEEDIQAQNPNELRGSLSDTALKQLLEKLNQYQPRVIGLNIYRPFPVQQNQQDLAKLLKQDKKLIVVCEVGDAKDNPSIPPPDEVPLQQIAFSDVPIDPDGIVRRQLLGMSPNSECNAEKSFSFQVAYHYLRGEGIQFKRTLPNTFQMGSTQFKKLEPTAGGYHQLDARGYQIMLNYRSSQAPAQTVTLSEILSDRFDPRWIQDRIILIGTTAQSINDGLLTPYSAGYSPIKSIPGVFIQAQMISQILSAVQDDRSLLWVLPKWGEALFILGFAVIGELLFIFCLTRRKHTILLSFILGSASLFCLGGIGYFSLTQGGWIPIVPSGLALILPGVIKVTVPKIIESK
ncbi:CHASE2 domain-containing protein [Capilliphycus salinus ALCB114379]|uniref:CHASE2 domain-containing protein n=1 Tax=Capilliphycus salinus TaxID=2768948 RepID=UPI0039A56946